MTQPTPTNSQQSTKPSAPTPPQNTKKGQEIDVNTDKKSITESQSIKFTHLWKYCPKKLKPLIFIAFLLSCLHGMVMPLMGTLFGRIAEDLTPDKSSEEIKRLGLESSLILLLLAGLSFIGASTGSFLWSYISSKMEETLKSLYFDKLMQQDVAWFDKENPERICSKSTSELATFRKGTGETIHSFIYCTATLITGLFRGFWIGYLFTTYMLICVPIMFGGVFIFTSMQIKQEVVTKESFAEAGAQSEQALTQIKTVKSLNGEGHELKRYLSHLKDALLKSKKYRTIASLSYGIYYFSVIFEYGISFYIGAQLIKNNTYNWNDNAAYNIRTVTQTFFSVIKGLMSIGGLGPSSQAISKARVAGWHIYKFLEEEVKIKYEDSNKKIIKGQLKGQIDLTNVQFSYPTRPNVKVLRNIAMKIKPGQKVAFVGKTGSGKSSIFQLIERFYDMDKGEIKIDNENIKNYNLKSLRSQIGYVGQEPKLFAMSIKDNLLLVKPQATDDEINSALKQAKAYNFIQELEHKMDTFVGIGGTQLSGGQKQRIAIARSILKNPSILLLDESTSALDTKNEKMIQETLDKFSKDRTTLTIAHRLSTIKNSDVIFVLEEGQIIEKGTHEELINLKGTYYKLVQEQNLSDQHVNRMSNLSKKIFKKDLDEERNDSNKYAIRLETETELTLLKKKSSLKKKLSINLKKKESSIKQKDSVMKNLISNLDGQKTKLTFALIASLISGCLWPSVGYFLGQMVSIYSEYQLLRNLGPSSGIDESDLSSRVNTTGLMLGIIAILAGVIFAIQMYLLENIGQKMTLKIRERLYSSLLNKNIPFFNEEKHNPGFLTSKLEKDSSTVNKLVGMSLSCIMQGGGSIIGGLTLAFIFSWRLALISIVCIPMMLITGILEGKVVRKANQGENKQKEEQKFKNQDLKIFQETATNIKTVSSMNCQENLYNIYKLDVKQQNKEALKNQLKFGLLFGFGQTSIFLISAFIFYPGSIFTQEYGLSFENLFTTFFVVSFAAYGAGQALQHVPDIGDTYSAAEEIYSIIYDPRVEKKSEKSKKLDNLDVVPIQAIQGDIEFRNVSFKYPGRDNYVFKNFNLIIKPHQNIALAGASGSGKSTFLSLLYRFYEPESGQILINGQEIDKYDLEILRDNLGLVSQEPVLFNSTINYNIQYNREYTQEEIINSSKIANAYDFITKDDFQENKLDKNVVSTDGKGFDRIVGMKGTKLSGGQKQRIAIARAVIRKPNIFIFDEATSALDSKSERLVQNALKKLSNGITTITIAHRVSTIKDSDVIFVLKDGSIAEQGKYQELMDRRGVFYMLNKEN